MRYILILTQYFTRIPVLMDLPHTKAAYRRASYFLSLHGAFVTLIPMGISLILAFFGAPAFINAVGTLSVHLGIAGAYHLDGLADSLDGLFSGRSRDRILEIMKDPAMGSWGTIGIVMDLALKIYVVQHLILTGQIFLLPLIAAGGKMALSFGGHLGITAKPDSSADLLIGNVPFPAVCVNLAFSLVLSSFLGVLLPAVSAMILIFLMVYYLNRICLRRIGGITGDNLGFLVEAGEILLGICLVWL